MIAKIAVKKLQNIDDDFDVIRTTADDTDALCDKLDVWMTNHYQRQ